MSDLKAARYVTVLAEQKTVRGAAEALYISPSALSMYIRKLEQELGAPLFVRDQKNFTPTQIGEAYIRRSYKILAVDQEFMDELALWRRRETRQISIGIYRRRGISFMVPLMKALEEMVPDVQFTFRLGSVKELELLLYGRQIDYILITHRLQNPDFTYQFVCGDRLLLACPASWEDRTEVSPDGTRILLPIEKTGSSCPAFTRVFTPLRPIFWRAMESTTPASPLPPTWKSICRAWLRNWAAALRWPATFPLFPISPVFSSPAPLSGRNRSAGLWPPCPRPWKQAASPSSKLPSTVRSRG